MEPGLAKEEWPSGRGSSIGLTPQLKLPGGIA